MDFELDFNTALFAAGAFLLLVGVLAEASYLAQSVEASGFLDLFSYGFMSTTFALFSGVLIGVGVALASDAAIMKLGGRHARIAFLSLICAACLCVSAVSFSLTSESQVLLLIIFFASSAAFLAFLVSLIVTSLCEYGGRLLQEKGGEDEPSQRKKGKGGQ